jgi:hypothetical protein
MYLHYVPVVELPLLTEYVSRAVRPDTIEAVFGDLPYVKKAAAELAKVLAVALPRGQRIQNGGFNRDDGLTRRMHVAGALGAFHRAYVNEVSLSEALLIGYRAYEGIAGHLRNTDGWIRFDRFIHSGLAIIRGGEHKLVACSHCSNQFVFHIDPMMAQGCPFCTAVREGTLRRIPAPARATSKVSHMVDPVLHPSLPVIEPSPVPSVLTALRGGLLQPADPIAPLLYQPGSLAAREAAHASAMT